MSTSDLSLEVEAQAPPIPEPPDDSRIEFTHEMTVLAFWSSSGAAVANGYLRDERWCGYGRNAGWGTWAEMVATFGESLRSLVLLKPYFPPAPLELTPEEQAAAARSEHMSTCHEEACVECMRELRVIRRIVKAIRPHIEKPLKERLEAAELVCDIFGAAGWSMPETERTKATEQAWQDWFGAYGLGVRTPDDVIAALAVRRDETRARALAAYREQIREQTLAGKFDVHPVAAASIPTPIPDGEE